MTCQIVRERRSRKNYNFSPKTAVGAFEALNTDDSVLGVVFLYEGIVDKGQNAIYFYAPFRPKRKVECSEPISFMGDAHGMTICWLEHDVATRVFFDEDAFLAELKLVGRAYFLEQSVKKVGQAKENQK